MPGRLTTHVLDTTAGRPAAAVAFELWQLKPVRRLLKHGWTNADGRTDGPLLVAPGTGVYELVWDIGAYFGGEGFLGVVPVRFTIADPEAHYHVPLLVSPWSYTTYRGN